jgi:hypothetical protein
MRWNAIRVLQAFALRIASGCISVQYTAQNGNVGIRAAWKQTVALRTAVEAMASAREDQCTVLYK